MTDREIWRIKKAVDYERFKPARRITRKIYMKKYRARVKAVTK